MCSALQEDQRENLTENYLNAIIHEEIERALVLKDRMQLPLKYSQLSGLVARCNKLLDLDISQLRGLSQQVSSPRPNPRYAWRSVRSIIRDIEWTEKYGLPALYYQSQEVGFLNGLMFKILREVNLPLEPPAVACLSTSYFYTAPVVDVIFVPLSEADFLLHLPDLYHELGHYTLGAMGNTKKLQELRANHQGAFAGVTQYYRNLLTQKTRDSAPEGIIELIRRIHSNWKSWIQEFFCDIFAVATLGPAYAWSHLHLSAKTSENVYSLSYVLPQSHPSDESRMRALLMVLRRIGFDKEAEEIEKRWKQVMSPWGAAPIEYQYAFPDEILEKISELWLSGLTNSGIVIASPAAVNGQTGEVRPLLNTAWQKFWESSPTDFRKWETDSLKQLRAGVA